MNLLKGSSKLILALLILISACKSGDDQLSGAIQPKDRKYGAFYTDSFGLKTTVVLYDSAVANNTQRLLAGIYADPVFGRVTASSYASFRQENFFNSLGPNPVADSIKLFYLTNSYSVGNINSTQYCNVYRLTGAVSSSTIYYPFDTIAHDAEVLARMPIAYSGGYQYVLLKKELAEEFVNNLNIFDSYADFTDYFPGLAIIPERGGTCIWGISDMVIRLYYHNYYALNNLLVLDSKDMVVSPSALEKFSNVKIRRSSPLQSLVNSFDSISTDATNNICYIQNNGGICTKVEIPGIEAFKKQVNKKILVNRAELIIKPDTLDINEYPIPHNLFAYELNEARTIKKTDPANISSSQLLQNELGGIFNNRSPLFVSFDHEKGQYTFVITAYMQALLDSSKTNNGLLISAYNQRGSSSGSSGVSSFANVDRMLFYKNNIQLRLYYTTFE